MDKKSTTLFIAPLALASGLAKGISVIAVTWWLKSYGISNTNIGLFSVINLMSILRIFWIPIFDKFDITKFVARCGIKTPNSIQRKGFVMLSSCLFSISIYFAANVGPAQLFNFALFLANSIFWLWNCDAIASAYTYETLKPKHMGVSTAFYRIGIFIAGALSLFMYEKFGIQWKIIFQFTSYITLLLNWFILFGPAEEPALIKGWHEAFIAPYQELFSRLRGHLFYIFLFMTFFKLEERFIAPMEQIFLRGESGLSSDQYTWLKFLSTFALAFAAMKSAPLLHKFGYKGTFSISILGGIGLVFCYFLCSLKTFIGYLLSIIASSILFLIFYRLRNSKIPYFIMVGLCILIPLAAFSFIPINVISIFWLQIISKSILGIRSSVLYGYQYSLASKEYALSQITIMTSIEGLISHSCSIFSGKFVDSYGWVSYYAFNLAMTCLPFLIINFVYFPKVS
jgi:hypothetical protein